MGIRHGLKKKKKKKKISMSYPKKYSKSPSVVHSIRASCENAAMFSCKKYNLADRVPFHCTIVFFFTLNFFFVNIFFYSMPDTLIKKKILCHIQKNILSLHQ